MIRRKSLLPLFVAALASATLHAVMLAGGWVHITRDTAEPAVLEARLAPAPAAPPIATEPTPAKAQPRKPLRPKKRAAPPSKPQLLALAPGRESPAAVVPVIPPREEPPAEEPVPEAEEAPPPIAEQPPPPDVVAIAPPTVRAPDPPPVRTLPRRGRITYMLFYGEQKFNIGRTVQSWQIDGDRYRLASASETTGIVDVFRSERRTYMSQGSVTSYGLRPDTFLMSRTRRGEVDEARARFDWDAGQVTWGGVNEQERAPLPPGSQDFLSLMYQLSVQPPRPGRISVAITTGTKFETYELDVLPEETIDTPLGALRAIPVKQVRKPGAETIQIWLASEYRYLPVRVQFYDRQGEPTGQQLVSDIRVSDETDANAPLAGR